MARALSIVFLSGLLTGSSTMIEGAHSPHAACTTKTPSTHTVSRAQGLTNSQEKTTLLEERFDNKMMRLETEIMDHLQTARETAAKDREANEALPPELYEATLNAFCEFSERSLEEARKNFDTIALKERLNGDKVKHDKDLYINCLYNCAKLYNLRNNPEDKDKIKRVIKEICAVLHESESLQSRIHDATEEQRQQHTFTEKQLEMLHSSWESAQETLRSYETKVDNAPQHVTGNSPT